jgi:flagellar basal-body rod protein FlgB
MSIGGLLGGSLGELESALRLRVTRQAALAANVANADTPGYRRVDVEFLPELARAAASLARTSAAHIAVPENSGVRLVQGPRGTRPDGNGVDRDRELVTLSRNAGEFGERADVLARVFTLRRIAATGEAR